MYNILVLFYYYYVSSYNIISNRAKIKRRRTMFQVSRLTDYYIDTNTAKPIWKVIRLNIIAAEKLNEIL